MTSQIHKPNAVLSDLKKGDKFKFNYDTFEVKRKYISDDKPLIAWNCDKLEDQRFYFEGLEIEKL